MAGGGCCCCCAAGVPLLLLLSPASPSFEYKTRVRRVVVEASWYETPLSLRMRRSGVGLGIPIGSSGGGGGRSDSGISSQAHVVGRAVL